MSLGAKELFHTNFLAYLLENESDDRTLIDIQKKLIEKLFGHNKIDRVITWREKFNLDLVIMPEPKSGNGNAFIGSADWSKDVIVVVIEAKLKSIPTKIQLEKYDSMLMNLNYKNAPLGITFELDEANKGRSDFSFMKLTLKLQEETKNIGVACTIEGLPKHRNNGEVAESSGYVRRILLSPVSPPEVDMGNWTYQSWDEVIDCLKFDVNADESQQGNETKLLKGIICDYRESLRNLLLILDNTRTYVNDSIKVKRIYKEYYAAITGKNFSDIRIHDLVGKYANHTLERGIVSCIETHLISQSQPKFQFQEFNKEFVLNSYTFFSNQQPGVTFEWLCKDEKLEVSFGVTIQGNDYRHFISVNGKNDVDRNLVLAQLEIILGNDDKNGWFLFHKNKRLILGKKKLAKVNTKTFYVFTKSKFRYSKATVNSLTLIELSEAVFNSLDKAKIMVTERCSDLCPQLSEFFKESSS